jgi:hypothetical protein
MHLDQVERSQQNKGPGGARFANIRLKPLRSSVWIRRGKRIGSFALRLSVHPGQDRKGAENGPPRLLLVISVRKQMKFPLSQNSGQFDLAFQKSCSISGSLS